MTRTATKYMLTPTEKTHCPGCNGHVTLLGSDAYSPRSPKFFICWTCKRVFEAGKGEVKGEQ